MVRDLAVACGKQVRLEMEGQETELDKTIIEAIRDPLTHLVRNAVDHGIEPPDERLRRGKPAEGRLSLHAFHEGGKVIIEIADDGAGIDPQRVRDKAIQAKLVTAEQADRMSERELVNLIFLPGFSTADKVTQFSGRGVGMDVVRTNIEKIGGTVDDREPARARHHGQDEDPADAGHHPGPDRHQRRRPLLPSRRSACWNWCGSRASRPSAGIEQIHGAPVYRLRGNLLPLVYLDRAACTIEMRANEPATTARSTSWCCRPTTASSAWSWTRSTTPRRSSSSRCGSSSRASARSPAPPSWATAGWP